MLEPNPMLVILLKYSLHFILHFTVLSLQRVLLKLSNHSILIVFKDIVQSLPALFVEEYFECLHVCVV